MEQEFDQLDPVVADRLVAVRQQYDSQVRRFEEAKAGLREIVEQIHNGRSQRELLHSSAFARLQARLDSMPVIEQAKGVLMAEQRCGPDEAFDLLRRASQRANVKVSALAAQIVERISQGAPPSPVSHRANGGRSATRGSD